MSNGTVWNNKTNGIYFNTQDEECNLCMSFTPCQIARLCTVNKSFIIKQEQIKDNAQDDVFKLKSACVKQT